MLLIIRMCVSLLLQILSGLCADYPVPVVSPFCPEGTWTKHGGYIRTGTHAVCQCRLSLPDSQLWEQVHVQWVDSNDTALSPAGNVSTLTIPTNPQDGDKKYKCMVTTESSSYVVIHPKIVDPIVNFKVNGTSSLVIQEGSHVIFSCEVESIFPAIAVLVGPERGRIREFRSQNQSLEFHLNNLTCQDTGRYECRGDDGVEIKTLQSERFVYISVKCAIRLKKGNGQFEFFFKRHENVTLHFDVEGYGYSPPTSYILTVTQGARWVEVSKELYRVNYKLDQIPFGVLSVEIKDKGIEESTVYNLNVQNGIGPGMDVKFVLHAAKEQVQKNPHGMNIGAGVASGFVIFIIAVIIGCKRRKIFGKTVNSQMQNTVLANRPLPEIPATQENTEVSTFLYEEIPYNTCSPDTDYIDPIDPPYIVSLGRISTYRSLVFKEEDAASSHNERDSIPETDYIDPIDSPYSVSLGKITNLSFVSNEEDEEDAASSHNERDSIPEPDYIDPIDPPYSVSLGKITNLSLVFNEED